VDHLNEELQNRSSTIAFRGVLFPLDLNGHSEM
jgi:hypothetical protein